VNSWVLTAAGGFLMAVVGLVLFTLAGGVEAGYEGNDRLAELGATLTVCGFLVLGVGTAGLIVTAIARRARGGSTDRPRDDD